MRHAGIVDEDRHRAERLLGRIERVAHRRAITHIGLDRNGFAAHFFNLRRERFQAIGPPRHERHRRAVFGQAFGEAYAEPARRTGHQSDFAVKIEDLSRSHDVRVRRNPTGSYVYSKTTLSYTTGRQHFAGRLAGPAGSEKSSSEITFC